MTPLSRAVLRRHLAPFGLAFATLTSLLLINQIAKQVPGLRSAGVPGSMILEVVMVSVPFIVAMTLPLAVLVAVLRVFTRLPSDPQVRLMAEAGVSVPRLVTPVLVAAACLTLVTFLWNDQVVPRSNHRLRTLLVDTRREAPLRIGNDAYKGDREMTIAELRQGARTARADAESAAVTGADGVAQAARQRAAMYDVEVHKKLAIAAACLVFALFGAAVGLVVAGGGIWVVAAVSVAVYSLYYVGLIGGEELGDRLIVSPFFAMWTPNLILGVAGLGILWAIRKRTVS